MLLEYGLRPVCNLVDKVERKYLVAGGKSNTRLAKIRSEGCGIAVPTRQILVSNQPSRNFFEMCPPEPGCWIPSNAGTSYKTDSITWYKDQLINPKRRPRPNNTFWQALAKME
jgi:hypothetical protein